MSLGRLSASSWRDGALFLTGLGLTIHELVFRTGPERPTVLLLLAGMMGLPAFLRADDRRAAQEPPQDAPSTPRDAQEPA